MDTTTNDIFVQSNAIMSVDGFTWNSISSVIRWTEENNTTTHHNLHFSRINAFYLAMSNQNQIDTLSKSLHDLLFVHEHGLRLNYT